MDKQLTRDFNLPPHSLLLPLSCFFFAAGCSGSLIRSNAEQEAIEELRFQLTKMSHKVRLLKQYDEICKMIRRLVSISTLTLIHSDTSVAIVSSVGQSSSDNFTMFPR